MSRKIFTAIWGAALAVFAASLVFIMGVSYNYFTGVQMKQLHAETALAAQGVSLCGKDYFTGLSTGDYRVTWIDADGTVLFDTGADASRMENHLEREEIRQALQNGTGEARRYSPTLADRQLYAAQRLPDGTVLRLSVVHLALWSLVLGFAQPICLVALLALGLSFLLASQLTKKIVAPINAIDPDNPMQYYEKDEYREIEPLLRRIAAQQAQLRRDRAEIERASLIRQEFTANVSHELKTPLHAISGYAELLESGLARPEDVKPFAGKIRTESGRMTKLVEDIIDLTRLDAGGEDYVFESCDLLRIAENAVDSLETEASGADVTLSLKGVSAPMQGVPQLLHSIVYNLCDNAIKYNRPGGRVDITVTPEDGAVVLTVSDTGVGIPKDSQGRIFERFYRVDKSRSKAVGGTGLGLSIVKHAALIQKADVRVESEPGEGSTFTVRFPEK